MKVFENQHCVNITLECICLLVCKRHLVNIYNLTTKQKEWSGWINVEEMKNWAEKYPECIFEKWVVNKKECAVF